MAEDNGEAQGLPGDNHRQLPGRAAQPRLLLAAHQQVTRDWWAGRGAFDLYISQFVLDEASAGDPDASSRRLAALVGLTLLDVTRQATDLAQDLVDGGGVPSRAMVDA